MGITFGDHLIDSGYHEITPQQEREQEAREECERQGLDPDDYAGDGILVWMVVDQELQIWRCPSCRRIFKNGVICVAPVVRGGCPMGGDV